MTIERLKEIKKQNEKRITLLKENKSLFDFEILMCSSSGCITSGKNELFDEFTDQLKKHNLAKKVKLTKTGCLGFCGAGPIVIIYPGEIFYTKVTKEDVEDIINRHILQGKLVERLLYRDKDGIIKQSVNDINFYNKQTYLVQKNMRYISPESIQDYISIDGYLAIYKTLTQMTTDDVIEILIKSGLRGRGGAGFPTGKKWQFAKGYQSDIKYIICNADEGDPGAFMDRSIIESNPHSIIEGMLIAGYSIGATKGIVYVRAEYNLAYERMKKAIDDAYTNGLIGKNIFGTSFCFDIDIKLGAGAFVCGEETALIRSCEGKRGEPKTRPPYPAENGYLGYPTIINNVETLANVANIILNGTDYFLKFGTTSSPGTKIFSLTGKVNNTGLVELPMGKTLKCIIEDIGGGVKDGKRLKAVQLGGPSGGCIPADKIDTLVDYESLKKVGAMVGSGGMIVLDEDTCMVNIAKFFLEFTVDESCGKCTPCRIGNKRMHEILTKICDGKANLSDLEELEKLAIYIQENSLCGLGQTSPNPVLSTLKYFKDEYISHIIDKKCPAKVCKNLMHYSILKDKCVGCTMCSRVCPVDAISGSIKQTHSINQEKCIKCGKCFDTCKFNAIIRG